MRLVTRLGGARRIRPPGASYDPVAFTEPLATASIRPRKTGPRWNGLDAACR